MAKVSTIIPSFCGNYTGCATKREMKLIRAIDSWLNQTHYDKELILVSDGRPDTEEIYHDKYSSKHNIKFIKLEKQPLFSGNVRQAGLDLSSAEIITYLDSDDYFTPSHLSNIDSRMEERGLDWCYFSDYLKVDKKNIQQRPVHVLSNGVIGTSNIAHRRSLNVSWSGCDGYGHDFIFIQRLMSASNNYEQIYGCGYIVCHTPNQIDN